MATVFFYLHRISRKENSACSACGHPLQDLNHLLLDCSASEPLRKSIFGSSLSLSILDLWSRPWGVARLLGSPRSSSAPPSLGRGWVEPPPSNGQTAGAGGFQPFWWWWWWVVLPDPFRGMGARRNSAETQQSGHTPRSGP